MNVCPDCGNGFVQPFRCVSCGAQKLYDHTVTSQAETIDALRAALDNCNSLRSALENSVAPLHARIAELEELVSDMREAREERAGTSGELSKV